MEHRRQRMQWRSLWFDIGKWALYRSVHSANPAAAIRNRNLSG